MQKMEKTIIYRQKKKKKSSLGWKDDSSTRVSMGLADRRKTAKKLADSRKN